SDHAAAEIAVRDAGVRPLVGERRAVAVAAAAGVEVPVELDEPARARLAVEAVDVLRREQETVADPFLEPRQRQVPGVRRDAAGAVAALGVEPPHERRVATEALRGRDLLDAVSLPQPAGAAERGNPRLRGHPGSGEDEHPRVRIDRQGPHGSAACTSGMGIANPDPSRYTQRSLARP